MKLPVGGKDGAAFSQYIGVKPTLVPITLKLEEDAERVKYAVDEQHVH